MNFGQGWKDFVGPCDKQTAEEIFVEYIRCGGNFIGAVHAKGREELGFEGLTGLKWLEYA